MSLILNGDGSIQNLNAGGLPSATVTQATLATPVAGTGPAFRAYVNTAQAALTTSTTVQMQLNAVNFDTASRFNATGSTVGGIPAYSFLPNVAGYYSVNASVYVTPDAANITVSEALIFKNGAVFTNGAYIPITGSSAGVIVNCSDLIYMNGTTDYLSFSCYSTTNTGNWTLRNGSASSFVSAVLARAA